MRTFVLLLLSCAAVSAHAADTWLVQVNRWGNLSTMTLQLQDEKGQLTGTLDGDKLTGSKTGTHLTFTVRDQQGER